MKHLFVPYELAFKLKEKGFDEPCFGFYNNADGNVWIKQDLSDDLKNIYKGDFEAPTHQQVIEWFRDKHRLFIYSQPIADRTSLNNTPKMAFIPCINKLHPDDFDDGFTTDDIEYDNYKALYKAIEQAIKLI